MTGYDVVIVGGGPCGLAFARALDGSGLRVAIVEQQPREALANPPSDGRDIALTHRSANILRALGAWDAIDPEDISPLVMAKVSNGASPFAMTFDTGGTREDRLGWLVPNRRIREALFRVTEDQAGLDLLSGETVTAIRPARDGKLVELASGATLHAPLLIAADSRFSATRDQLGIPADITRLGRSMLVCRVAHEDDHHGIATEWFDYRQTIALLPLNGRKSSFVLTLPSAEVSVRPFNCTSVKSVGRPRIVTFCPSPRKRVICTPVTRCKDSATFSVGNLPTSSAEITSTTVSATRFVSMAVSRLCRTPETTTS